MSATLTSSITYAVHVHVHCTSHVDLHATKHWMTRHNNYEYGFSERFEQVTSLHNHVHSQQIPNYMYIVQTYVGYMHILWIKLGELSQGKRTFHNSTISRWSMTTLPNFKSRHTKTYNVHGHCTFTADGYVSDYHVVLYTCTSPALRTYDSDQVIPKDLSGGSYCLPAKFIARADWVAEISGPF